MLRGTLSPSEQCMRTKNIGQRCYVVYSVVLFHRLRAAVLITDLWTSTKQVNLNYLET